MTERASSPGEGLLALVLGAGLVIVTAMYVQRPVVRVAGDEPPPAHLRPWPDMRLDLNAATAGELTALPGIGPTLSERIVDDREQRGPFTSVDDLQRVHRVGPRLVADVREHVLVDNAEPIGAR